MSGDDFPIIMTLHLPPWEKTLGWLFLDQCGAGVGGGRCGAGLTIS